MIVEPGDAVGLDDPLAYSPTRTFNPRTGSSEPDMHATGCGHVEAGSVVMVLSVVNGRLAGLVMPAPDPDPTVMVMACDGTYGWTTACRLSGSLLRARSR